MNKSVLYYKSFKQNNGKPQLPKYQSGGNKKSNLNVRLKKINIESIEK